MSSVLFFTNDLMFPSRVSPLVTRQGGQMKVVSTAEALIAEAKTSPPKLLLIDLSSAPPSLAETLDVVRHDGSPFIVAYAPHVHEGKLDAARQFADLTLTRGQFDQSIAQIIEQHLTTISD